MEIFISHRSIDKEYADLLVDFLVSLGLNKSKFFCSSLPGNDVKSKIDTEIKRNLQKSSFNAIILSKDYFESAYCLNEEGIIWFQEKPFFIIALPEVTPANIVGLIDKNYILRRLDSNSDLSAIYDMVNEVFQINCSSSLLNAEIDKTIKRYNSLISTRKIPQKETTQPNFNFTIEELTDDEALVLYYLRKHQKRKVTRVELSNWLIQEEFYNFDIDNGFDLLAESKVGILNDNVFELELSLFRKINSASEELDELAGFILPHYISSAQTFVSLWETGKLKPIEKLFVAYILDEKVVSFGSRWLAEWQVEDIKRWTEKNNLFTNLPKEYDGCLQLFIENNLVYPSSFTSYGNPREYSLHKTIKNYFFGDEFPFSHEINEIKKKYTDEDFPF